MSVTPLLTIEEFRERVDDARAICQICGFREHSIVRHLQEKHQMTPGQYKKQYPNASLASPIVSELIRTMSRRKQTTEAFEAFLEAFEGQNDSTVRASVVKLVKPAADQNSELIPALMPEFFFEPRWTKALTYAIATSSNAFIEGPTGCGKTELAFQIHALARREIKRVNMNGDVTVSNFIGKTEADPQKGTFFSPGNLPKAMKGGYTLLIDEVDYMPPAIAAVLNSVLEGKRSLYIPETDETVVAAPGFNVIATGNTGGKGDTTGVYTGTEVMNTALLDRFAVKLKVSYLDSKLEKEMLIKRFPGQDPVRIEKIIKVATDVRRAFMEGSGSYTISTRKIIDLLQMEPFMGLEEAINCSIINWLDSDGQSVVRGMFDRQGLMK